MPMPERHLAGKLGSDLLGETRTIQRRGGGIQVPRSSQIWKEGSKKMRCGSIPFIVALRCRDIGGRERTYEKDIPTKWIEDEQAFEVHTSQRKKATKSSEHKPN